MRLHVTALLCFLACGGADPSPGLDLSLRVPGAQVTREAFPTAAGGPAITFVDLRAPRVSPGASGKGLSGRAGAGAFAIHVGLDGDDGHVIVPTGYVDPDVASELGWEARLDVAPGARLGPRSLRLVAVDRAGRGGPATVVPLEIVDGTPIGALVIAVAWDRVADLDLVVATPSGAVLGPTTAALVGPDGAPFARLDADAGAGCRIEGARREHAVWPAHVPSGRYAIYLRAASLCGELRASAQVTVFRSGTKWFAVDAVLHDDDARNTGRFDEAPGLAVAGFDVP